MEKRGFQKVNLAIANAYKEKKRLLETANVQQKVIEDDLRFVYDGSDEEIKDAIAFVECMQTGGRVLASPFIGPDGRQKITYGEEEKFCFVDAAEVLNKAIASVPTSAAIPEPGTVPESNILSSGVLPGVANMPTRGAADLPASIYGGSGVYVPKKLSFERYETRPKLALREIVYRIMENVVVRSFDRLLYVFTSQPTRFKPLAGHQAQQFIDDWARRLGYAVTPGEIDEIKRTLLYDSRLAIPEKVPLPPRFWPFWDGLVDIQTGNCIENDGRYFYTQTLSCPYVPAASCPLFDTFLESCTGGDPQLVELLWEAIGYLLADDVKAKAFFVFMGPKDSGKSLMANVIAALLGEEATRAIGINEVAQRFAVSELDGKRLALCMDIGNEPLNEAAVAMIKSITGGDLIRIEEKYKKGVTTTIRARFLFGTNHSIRIKSPDPAFADRQIVIPFSYPIPKEHQDKELFEKIQTEFPGIAVKAMKAYMRLVANNYVFPDISGIMPDVKVINHETVIGDFITQCCMLDTKERISTEELYQGYQRFTMERSLPAVEKGRFSDIFHRLQPDLTLKKIKFGEKSLQGYTGVRLKFQDEGN